MIGYLNQDLLWQHVSTISAYNEPTYTTSTIKGRLQDTSRMVSNSLGQTVTSGALVLTTAAVTVNDLIDGRLVLRVDTLRWADGAINHYEVYLQ